MLNNCIITVKVFSVLNTFLTLDSCSFIQNNIKMIFQTYNAIIYCLHWIKVPDSWSESM